MKKMTNDNGVYQLTGETREGLSKSAYYNRDLAPTLDDKGLIPERLLEGMKLRFGNAGDMVAALEAIASQTGFGRIMGQGVAACSELLGPETADFACHVKGQEMAYHEDQIWLRPGVCRVSHRSRSPAHDERPQLRFRPQ